MGKYNGCLTINQVCKLECKEANEILKSNKVPKEDRKEIMGMIREAYFQFEQSNELNKRFIKFICKKYDTSEEQLSKDFINHEISGSASVQKLIRRSK